MTSYQVWTLFGLGAIAFGLFLVAIAISDLRKEVAQIWKRLPRVD